MSVYKIVIGKDMAPQNKNTSHIYMGRFFLTGFSTMDVCIASWPGKQPI